VFLGLGLGADSRLGVPGEDGEGVYGATHLIERIKTEPGLKLEGVSRALVVGGGNTALDIAHELALMGVEVDMAYRRSEEEMGGYVHELDGAREDGVRLLENRQLAEILRQDGKIVAVQLLTTQNGKAVLDTEEVLPAELVVMAIGQERATGVAKAFPGVEVDARGRVKVDAATHRTGNAKVWSGGDCVNGGKEVVNAAAEAKIAVRDIQRHLAGE
jgi:glutamate synthase (NADPH/NADH) small chain